MSQAPKLPAVLQQPNDNSLSVDRVLSQAIGFLIRYDTSDSREEDALLICIDDLNTMLNNIDI